MLAFRDDFRDLLYLGLRVELPVGQGQLPLRPLHRHLLDHLGRVRRRRQVDDVGAVGGEVRVPGLRRRGTVHGHQRRRVLAGVRRGERRGPRVRLRLGLSVRLGLRLGVCLGLRLGVRLGLRLRLSVRRLRRRLRGQHRVVRRHHALLDGVGRRVHGVR